MLLNESCLGDQMVKCFYLVSSVKKDDAESLSKVKNEVEIFRRMNNADVELMFFEDIIPIAENEFNGKILLKDGEVDCPDFIYVRAFDLGDKQYHLNAVLEMFENLGVLCVNSPKTKAITSDKLLTMQIARSVCNYMKIPKTILVTPEISASKVGEIIGFPLVIKIMHGSKGKGVALVKTEKELENLLNMVFAAPFNDQVMAQEAILSSKGRDLRLVFAFDKLIDTYVRVNDDDFKSNISTGGHFEQYDVPDELVEDALKFIKAIDLKMGSIDFLFGENEDEFYLCEANSTIGLSRVLEAFANGDNEYLSRFKNLMPDFEK